MFDSPPRPVSRQILRSEDVVKDYGKKRALDGVTLEVQSGEVVGLLGPNGAGKSTFMKIVCGLVRPTAGKVTVLGHPSGSPASRSSLGYLAELFRFPGWLTADEVIRLHQRLASSGGGRSEREEVLALVGLTSATDVRVGAMSKGMQQRLGIAQALVGDPQLLLLDEPTSALDPAGRREMRQMLAAIAERGIAVLLSSHLLGEIEMLCGRVVIVFKGQIVREGRPDQLVTSQGVEIQTDDGIRKYPDASREEIPDIVAALVAEGVSIYEARMVRSSLEDVYIDAVEDAER